MDVQKMDAHMLLSIINMKLRDAFPSLEALTDDLNIEKEALISKLGTIGYHYVEDLNQFIPK